MRTLYYFLSVLLFFALLGCNQQAKKDISKKPLVQQKGGGHDEPADDSIAPDESGPPSFEESIPLPERDCGSEEINPETGERIVVPNVDLVISHVEIFSTDLGTWVRPTVKNNCGDTVEGELAILIRSDSDVDVGLITSARVNIPGHSEVEWEYALGVPEGTSYTVIANWGNSIPEANYGNNRCVRSTTGNCP